MTAPLTGNLIEDLKNATSPELFSPSSACLTQQLAWRLSETTAYDPLLCPGWEDCVDIITEKYGDEHAEGIGNLYFASAKCGLGPEGHAQAVKIAEELFAWRME